MIRLRIEEVGSEPNSGILEIRSIRLTAGEKEIVSLPRFCAVFQRHAPVSPSVSTFSTFLGSKHKSKEAVFVDVPSNSSSFAQFFQHSKSNSNSNCSICVSISLPAVLISLDQQSVLPFLQFLQSVEKNASASPVSPVSPFPHFIPAVYETPFLGVSLTCPGVSLHVASDLFQWKERSRFLALSLASLRADCFLGTQNFDCTLAVGSVRAALRFMHLASPLTLETLTGYPPPPSPIGETVETVETVETESWEAAKLRFASLPAREIEVLAVDASRFHVSTSLHVLPSLHTWLLTAGEQSHSSVQVCEVGWGTRIRADCELGMIELVWDDVGIADLVWAVLTVCDVLACLLPPRFEEEKRAGEALNHGSDCLFQFTSPLLTLTLLYNQKPFQELSVPAVFFEFGFAQHVATDEVFPAQFVCGLQTRGAYWTDLTNDLPTNQVPFFSTVRFPLDFPLAKQRSRRVLGPLPAHLARRRRLFALQYALSLSLSLTRSSLRGGRNRERRVPPSRSSAHGNRKVSFSLFLSLTPSWFFASFYPTIMWIAYYDLPYRRSSRLQVSPLAESLQLHPDTSLHFRQPACPSASEFRANVTVWPLVEAVLRNLLIRLPQASNRPDGVSLELVETLLYTAKPHGPTVPLGSFIRTGYSLAEIRRERAKRPRDSCITTVFRTACSDPERMIFPRFLIEAQKARLLSCHNGQTISNNLQFTVQFRSKVVLPAEARKEAETLPSEQKLLFYHPQLEKRGTESAIPNAAGLPMEVSVRFEEFPVSLHQDDYADFLYFFFLNLSEVPTVCCDAYLPKCARCGWTHEPGLRCSDCWCVLHMRCDRVLMQPVQGKGTCIVPPKGA